jgi:predicted kinase
MQTITLTRGLPASGKSTWAKAQVANSNGKIVRVNMDDIRSMLALPYSTYTEELALKVQDQAILAAVKAGRDVIVDNTHIEKKMPTRIKKLFDGDVLFKIQDFTDVPLGWCLERDYVRENRVGEEVIRKMAARLPKVSITEEWLNDVALSPKYMAPAGKEMALIVDIDGTLAEHVARSPYDYSRVKTDAVIPSIKELVNTYYRKGYVILMTSGRPDINNVRKDTIDWLEDNEILWDHLLMRPADMLKENDADVKQHLFDTQIREWYQVKFVLDDRDRVVRRWRKLGLKVLQVAPGAF